MHPPWKEDSWALPGLLLLVSVLGSAYLFKSNYISKEAIKADKDFYTAISSLATLSVFAIGGALSYIRFFKGRTLAAKMNLGLKSGMISGPANNLHWLELEMTNTGSVTVWHYKIRIKAILMKGDYTCACDIADFISPPEEAGEVLVDVGESAYEQAYIVVPKEVDAVTLQAIVIDKYRHVWYRSITVNNKEMDSTQK
jgi:hypothetical protein